MYALIIVFAVVSAILAMRHLGRIPQHKQNTFKRQVMGLGLCVAGLFLALKGQMVMAIPVLGIGAGFLGWKNLPFQTSANSNVATGPMDRNEALSVLGLTKAATAEEIRAAHKNLLRATHPDAGGSTYLAAKINAARDLLLKS